MGGTAPNPMVGCVIVHREKIIGEGFTSPYGKAHAEVNAIRSVRNGALLKKSVLYVTLEPCSHYGNTPPCCDLILEHKIPQVVIGLRDPHDKVSGRGIEKLRASGCEVTVGILEKECRFHHKRFLSLHELKRPYIILKWAETQDGFIAPTAQMRKENPVPYWITNPLSRQRVQQWRSEEQAILVGTNTVLEDNPQLTVRAWQGKNPTKILLDRKLKIPSSFHVLDGLVETIVLTEVGKPSQYAKGIDYEQINFTLDIGKQICAVLNKRSITSVLVEGGARTLQTFIDEGLWDEARVFRGKQAFKNGVLAPRISGRLLETEHLLSDTLTVFVP